jgi:dTDP-4-dehydrorhamnose reductase
LVKVLVFGAGGMLGQDLLRAARLANHRVIGLARSDADITDAAGVERAVESEAPDAVVNCAAFTNVDGAEEQSAEARRVNADGARNVALAAAKVGASVLYPSSDYVFDGSKGSPYVESDEPSPLSSYGASKLAGEVETSAVNPRHFIVRSSWLFGTSGRNFVETMLELGSEQPQVVVVRDQTGSPTYTAHLAEGLVRLLATDAYGLHHMASAGECTWYDFAVEIFDQAGVKCSVMSATTAELGRPASRPEYSVLGTQWEEAIHLPDWRQGLRSYLVERAS